MKIICTHCKMILGEQEPFDNPVEIKAKCPVCITKDKEVAPRFTPKPKPGQKQEVTLENGLKGFLWVAQDEGDKLFIGELAVSGKKFYCSKHSRQEFQNYLGSLTGEEIEVTVLHSMTCKLDSPPKGRKKKQDLPKTEEPRKDDSIQYNCTMRAPKHYVQLMFDDMAERMDKVIEILAEVAYKAYKEDCLKEVQNGDQILMRPPEKEK
ncbi:MAG: hypothetical protein HQL24_04060 [Candidatus Omnitrophica bacterium]|nr:hypothetical protein [Candidatus Omnitrophota bacterium]